MLEFLDEKILAIFGGRVFQQTVGINMGTNCASCLVDQANKEATEPRVPSG